MGRADPAATRVATASAGKAAAAASSSSSPSSAAAPPAASAAGHHRDLFAREDLVVSPAVPAARIRTGLCDAGQTLAPIGRARDQVLVDHQPRSVFGTLVRLN